MSRGANLFRDRRGRGNTGSTNIRGVYTYRNLSTGEGGGLTGVAVAKTGITNIRGVYRNMSRKGGWWLTYFKFPGVGYLNITSTINSSSYQVWGLFSIHTD